MATDLVRRAQDLATDGLLLRRDAVAAGMDGRVVDRQVAAGSWISLLPGVALTRPGPASTRDRDRAALLWAGPTAVLTGVAGCRAWDLAPLPHSDVVQVLEPQACRSRSRGFVRVRRTRLPVQVQERYGLRVAPPERCVVDAARLMPDLREVRALVLPAARSAWCTEPALRDILERSGSAGSALCRRALSDARGGAWSAPEAEAADLVMPLVRRGSLPLVLLNAELWLDGRLLGRPDGWLLGTDVGWEVDSREHHGSQQALDATLDRHERFGAAGLTLLHRSPQRLRLAGKAFVDELVARVARGGVPPPGLCVRPYRP